MIEAQLLRHCGNELGEGPVWDSCLDKLHWVDIDRGEVWSSDIDCTMPTAIELGEPVGSIALCADGSLLAAVPRGLRRLKPNTDDTAPLAYEIPELSSHLRMNDGGVDPIGRFVVGTTSRGRALPAAAALWSFDQGKVQCIRRGVTISNGIAWSADGSRVYYIDTPTQQICEFEYLVDSGAFGRQISTIEIDVSAGAPDGLAIDSEGGLWVALWGGGAVRRYLGGRQTETVAVSTPLVTSVAFVGPNLDILVVTTAVPLHERRSERQSSAGGLFRCVPGVQGLPIPLCKL